VMGRLPGRPYPADMLAPALEECAHAGRSKADEPGRLTAMEAVARSLPDLRGGNRSRFRGILLVCVVPITAACGLGFAMVGALLVGSMRSGSRAWRIG
jgi:hypothetical protein